MKFEAKEDAEVIHADDFLYDLIYGGYITPRTLVKLEQADKVLDAIATILAFEEFLDETGLVEYR